MAATVTAASVKGQAEAVQGNLGDPVVADEARNPEGRSTRQGEVAGGVLGHCPTRIVRGGAGQGWSRDSRGQSAAARSSPSAKR